jgi:hypothetical protein
MAHDTQLLLDLFEATDAKGDLVVAEAMQVVVQAMLEIEGSEEPKLALKAMR